MRGQIAVKNYAVDSSGYITVRGKRVAGASKMPVKLRKTCAEHCQLCKRLNVLCELGVFMRYETAFNMPFYWNDILGKIPSYCGDCTRNQS